MDYKKLSKISDSEITRISCDTEQADRFFNLLQQEGKAEVEYRYGQGSPYYVYFLNGARVALFDPSAQRLTIQPGYEYIIDKSLEIISDSSISFESMMDICHAVEEHFPDLSLSCSVSFDRSLPYGFLDYPSVRVKGENLGESCEEVESYIQSLYPEYHVVCNCDDDLDIWIVFSADAERVLKKLLGITSVQDSNNPEKVEDSRTEDAEVIAELCVNIENRLDDFVKDFEDDEFPFDTSDLSVDFDPDTNTICVEWPSAGDEFIDDIKLAIEEVLDGNFYLSESQLPDYPLFYIAFDKETIDLFDGD